MPGPIKLLRKSWPDPSEYLRVTASGLFFGFSAVGRLCWEGLAYRRGRVSRCVVYGLHLRIKAMNRSLAALLAILFFIAELAAAFAPARSHAASPKRDAGVSMDMFDAMQNGAIEAKFVARSSEKGRIIMENKTAAAISIEIPDAFIGIPMAQMGGMGGGLLGGGGGGGGQQSVGGGGGGGRGGGGRGGGGRGGGGRGGGGFNIPPEAIVRVDVPLLCLDHGLKDPSSSKPYAIRPIENYVQDPALIAVVAAYANGDLPPGAAQAAAWHINSEVSWDALASKLTGTVRNINRQPYFSQDEIQAGMAIVSEARQATAGKKVEPRPFKLPGEKDAADTADASEIVSPGDEATPGEGEADEAEDAEKNETDKAEADKPDADAEKSEKKDDAAAEVKAA